ncbi:MAG: helix-turn-helix domain-containing protein [Bacteroidales bacterium]|jgi:AraC-like DNA-binding protein|nr:helix-turn-helix domain-containing protein [Bacteroidales bacterium]
MKVEKVKDSKKKTEGRFLENVRNHPLVECTKLEAGETVASYSQSVKIIFILSGEVEVSVGTSERNRKKLVAWDFFLLPQEEKFLITAQQESEVMKFLISAPKYSVLEYFPFDYFRKLKQEATAEEEEKAEGEKMEVNKKKKHLFTDKYPPKGMQILRADKRLKDFLKFLNATTKDGLTHFFYQDIKVKELYYLLTTYFPEKQLTLFFYPMFNNDLVFAKMVFDNIEHIHSANDLAKIACYTVSGVKTRFKSVFNMSVSRWLDQQKAKKIYYDICNTKRSFKALALKYGFYSNAHLNHFCLRMFGENPSAIRKGIGKTGQYPQ